MRDANADVDALGKGMNRAFAFGQSREQPVTRRAAVIRRW
jgi:hypothetical protein